MAEVVMKFNTVDKSMAVTIDGKVVSDVVEVNAYIDKYGDNNKGRCSVLTSTEDKDNKTRVMTMLTASDTTEGRKATANSNIASGFEGFVATRRDDTDKVLADIKNYFQKE